MDYRKLFLKIETPEQYMDFKKKYPDVNFDKTMSKHLQKIALRFSNGETPENHTDPREAFLPENQFKK